MKNFKLTIIDGVVFIDYGKLVDHVYSVTPKYNGTIGMITNTVVNIIRDYIVTLSDQKYIIITYNHTYTHPFISRYVDYVYFTTGVCLKNKYDEEELPEKAQSFLNLMIKL